jgi:hypothetical protein
MLARRGLQFDPRTRSLYRANTFQDRPWLFQFASHGNHLINLVTARKGSSVKKDGSPGVFLQNPGRRLEHDLHHEVVLRGGILNFRGRKDGMTNLVLAEDGPVDARRQRPCERGLARARESDHKDDHEYGKKGLLLAELFEGLVIPVENVLSLAPARVAV